jgi:HK97 family phage portal protein
MFIAHDIGAASSVTDDFWYTTTAAGAGVRVSSDTAMRLSTVYKCVRVRAETIGMLPLQVYRRLPNGGKEQDDSHPLAGLLHDQPNPWQTAMQWRMMMQAHLDLRGNAYSRIVYAGSGRVDMLVPMHPDRVRVEMMPGGQPRYRYRTDDGREQVLVFGEVLHIAGMSVDGYCGINPIEAEREAIASAIATRDHGARYFSNSARPPMWIKMPGKFSSPDAKRQWVNDFSDAYGGINAGKTPVMDQGMELNAIPISNVDAQYLESRAAQDIDIAGIFRVPPHKLGILDRATWGNIEHQNIDFVTDCILPSCVTWEQALLRDLDFGSDHFAEYKVAMLLRGDTKTRYEAYGKGIQDGWLTRNEARRMENLNAIDGLDVPLEPLNMQPAGSRRAAQERGEPAEASGNGERQALIMAAAAERVARKEISIISRAARSGEPLAELFAGHAGFVADVMAVSMSAAERHVADTIERAQTWIAPGARKLEADAHAVQTSALMRLET